nr:hypothetical protein [Sinorhizobium medicae]
MWQNIADGLSRQGELRSGILLDDGLAVIVPGGSDRPTRLIVLRDSALFDAVGKLASDEPLFASERRLLKQLICGFNLAAAAALDGVSHETKRSQFKSLARKLGGGSQAEIASRALSRVFLEIASVSRPGVPHDDYFDDLLREFAPGARTLRLRCRSGKSHRFVDVGPVDGRPAVMLHPMILPDLREGDIEALKTLSTRLIITLAPRRDVARNSRFECLRPSRSRLRRDRSRAKAFLRRPGRYHGLHKRNGLRAGICSPSP